MRIADVCSHRVVCISPGASVHEAAALMRKDDVGALVVTRDRQRDLVGIITDRDLVTRVMASESSLHAPSVGDVMTRSVATCHGGDELLDVLELMRHRGIRRVPVVDAQSSLIGIVTTDDLIGALSEHVLTLARSLLSEDALERKRYRDEGVAINAVNLPAH